MVEPVVETTEEELFDTSPALFSKLLIRRFHIGVLNGKLALCKTTTKSLLKAQVELVALVTLRVPPVLTVALLNFYHPSRGLLREIGRASCRERVLRLV